MNRIPYKPAALALALGLALAGAAIAQSTPTAAQRKELDAARAALDQAAQRLAELHRKYGEAGGPIRIERRVLRKPVIGVLLAPDDASGVRIAGVTPDSAAAAGGLKSGDRIVGIDGRPLKATSPAARVDEARELLAATTGDAPVRLEYQRDGKTRVLAVTPRMGDRLLVMPDDAMFDDDIRALANDEADMRVQVERARMGAGDAARRAGDAAARARIAAGDARRKAEWAAAVAPDVRREIVLLGSDCSGDNCKLPMLAEAFRWNGLNLASIDAGLGRYFGTSDGVLVLSTGKELEGLQAGDVIRRIDGRPVNSPREAMEALRAQPADAQVRVDYLRDRKAATARIAVPEALPFRIPPPPAPPAPPAPPTPRGLPAPPAPPAAPRARAQPRVVEQRTMVFVDKDGKRTVVHEGDLPLPPAPPAAPIPPGTTAPPAPPQPPPPPSSGD